MQAVDSASAHTEGYFLADKCAEMTLEAFKAYYVMAECQTGKKLHCFRTDEGPEFINELWKAYCTGHGIIHEMITAYSFQSNGIVKWSNCTIIKRVHVLLNESGLFKSMWAEVAATVIYLKNFIPTA